MTWVGKLLVVMHLVLSMMFMALAGAVFNAQTNWKKSRDQVQQQLTQEQGKSRELDAQLQAEKTASTQRITDLEGQVSLLTGEKQNLTTSVAALEAEAKQLKVAYDAQRDLAALNSTEAEERTRESRQERAQNADLFASRDDLVQKIHELEEQTFSQQVLAQQMETKHQKALRDNAKMREFLAANNLPTDPREMLVQEQSAPALEGLVLDVRKAEKGNQEYVEISLGSNENLVVGHKATIYRGDKYLGLIRLTWVDRNRAVGIVDQKAKNAVIEKGDNVTTRF